jgi:phosphoenolpyruvate carboxykinase (GTP)
VGELRRDPFAMLPFCGYNMADYWGHWLSVGKATDPEKLPRIYQVNWFRKDADGNYIWPGYGENSRVLAWIVDRLEGLADAVETPIGRVPVEGGIDITGLDIDPAVMHDLFVVDRDSWLAEAELTGEYFAKFGDRVPAELHAQLDTIKTRLHNA